jgi:ComEC/Rec2-related protein
MVIPEAPQYTNYRTLWMYQGKRIVVQESDQTLRWGDRVRVRGKVGINDFTGMLELNLSELVILEKSNWFYKLLNRLLEWRSVLVNTYRITLGEPQASLLSGIVLGKGEKMPGSLYQALVKSGTVHVVAASGFNVTLVARAVMSLLLLIAPRRVAVCLALLAIGGYVVLAGAGPAVFRAGLMGMLVFVATALGRDYMALWGLFSSSVFMLLLWPWLWFDVSFQLSVSATAGLLLIAPLLFSSQRASKSSGSMSKMLMTDLRSTLAATLTTLPIVTIVFGRFSLISPITNVLVLWLVPPLMVGGSLLAFAGLLCPPLAYILAWFMWPLLSVFIGIVQVSGSWAYASVGIERINWWLGWGWWVFLSAWVFYRRKQENL